EFPAGREGERSTEVRQLPLVLPAVAQHRVLRPRGGKGRDANVGRSRGVKAVPAGGAEGAEPGEVQVQALCPRLEARKPRLARVLGAEHRLPEVLVRGRVPGIVVREKLVPQRLLGARERLLRAVVEAGNAERE